MNLFRWMAEVVRRWWRRRVDRDLATDAAAREERQAFVARLEADVRAMRRQPRRLS